MRVCYGVFVRDVLGHRLVIRYKCSLCQFIVVSHRATASITLAFENDVVDFPFPLLHCVVGSISFAMDQNELLEIYAMPDLFRDLEEFFTESFQNVRHAVPSRVLSEWAMTESHMALLNTAIQGYVQILATCQRFVLRGIGRVATQFTMLIVDQDRPGVVNVRTIDFAGTVKNIIILLSNVFTGAMCSVEDLEAVVHDVLGSPELNLTKASDMCIRFLRDLGFEVEDLDPECTIKEHIDVCSQTNQIITWAVICHVSHHMQSHMQVNRDKPEHEIVSRRSWLQNRIALSPLKIDCLESEHGEGFIVFHQGRLTQHMVFRYLSVTFAQMHAAWGPVLYRPRAQDFSGKTVPYVTVAGCVMLHSWHDFQGFLRIGEEQVIHLSSQSMTDIERNDARRDDPATTNTRGGTEVAPDPDRTASSSRQDDKFDTNDDFIYPEWSSGDLLELELKILITPEHGRSILRFAPFPIPAPSGVEQGRSAQAESSRDGARGHGWETLRF